jgi:uncharacterized protein (DUF1501 family)
VYAGPPLWGADLQRTLAQAAALDHALQEAYGAWLDDHLSQTSSPDAIMAGLGLFVGAAVRRLIGSLGLPPAAAAAYREHWLARLRASLEEERGDATRHISAE